MNEHFPIDFTHNPYEQEARQRWGDEAVNRSSARVQSMTPAQQAQTARTMDSLFIQCAALRSMPADTPQVQQLVGQLFHFFTADLHIPFTPQAFAGLGRLYVEDERFQKNIDRHGQGLSVFLRDAMAYWAAQQD